MAVQQLVNVTLTVIPDGVTTSFPIDLEKVFAFSTDYPIVNPKAIPDGVSSVSGISPAPTATLSKRVITLSFGSAPTDPSQITIGLLFNL